MVEKQRVRRFTKEETLANIKKAIEEGHTEMAKAFEEARGKKGEKRKKVGRKP